MCIYVCACVYFVHTLKNYACVVKVGNTETKVHTGVVVTSGERGVGWNDG